MHCALTIFITATDQARAKARSMERMRVNHMHTRELGPPHRVVQLHIAIVSNTDIIITGVHAGETSATEANRPVVIDGKARLVTLWPIMATLGVMFRCVQDVSNKQPTTPVRKGQRTCK